MFNWQKYLLTLLLWLSICLAFRLCFSNQIIPWTWENHCCHYYCIFLLFPAISYHILYCIFICIFFNCCHAMFVYAPSDDYWSFYFSKISCSKMHILKQVQVLKCSWLCSHLHNPYVIVSNIPVHWQLIRWPATVGLWSKHLQVPKSLGILRWNACWRSQNYTFDWGKRRLIEVTGTTKIFPSLPDQDWLHKQLM